MAKRQLKTLAHALGGPHMLAFIPLFTLGAFWAWGEAGLIAAAAGMPLLLASLGTFRERSSLGGERDSLTGLILRDGLIDWADRALKKMARKDRQVAVIAFTIDGIDEIEERFGRSMRDTIMREAVGRVRTLLREEDVMARLGPGFAVGLQNVRPPETETLLQLARRMQSVFEEPFCEGPTRTYCSISLGLAAVCHVKSATGANVVAGAQRACELAHVSQPGAIRTYSDGLSSDSALDRDMARELSTALETNEIFAWFQPQLHVADRRVIGFEALARWDHPERGLLSPASFLPDIEHAGLSQRLAEVILKQSLMALNAWDAAGFETLQVSVNFSSEELRNPRLPDYVRWELDRHGIAPERLVIEVLETVASDSCEDAVARTLIALARTGCRIDLDDFGTGFTCFANIRRFDVDRIKIDRSLVSHIDHDAAQHRMFSALLAFSRKLGIEALAEGVETEAEIATLRELGCRDMQGYALARPQPLGETLLWLEEHGALFEGGNVQPLSGSG